MSPTDAAARERANKFVRAHVHLCYATDSKFCFDCQEMEKDLLTFATHEAERATKEIGDVIGWEPGEKTLLQAVKDEWHDFMMVCHHCSLIYDAASGGLISKPNTLPAEVIRVMEDRENEEIDEAVKEAEERARAEERERIIQLCVEHDNTCLDPQGCDVMTIAEALRPRPRATEG